VIARVPRSLRVRLALWYALVLATVLAASAIVAWVGFARLTLAQVDEELGDFASAIGGTLARELAGRRATAAGPEDVADAVGELGFSDLAVAVRDSASGTVSFAAVPALDHRDAPEEALSVSGAAPRLEAELAAAVGARWRRNGPRTVESAGGSLRVVLVPIEAGGRGLMLAVAHPLLRRERLLDDVATGFAIGIPVVLLLASGGGRWLARKGLAPVVAMSQQARRMGAATLHERLPVAADDELGDLATTFNELLQRLDSAFEQQRRFLADASHELRTPVAILGGEAQHALARPDRSPEELRAALSVMRDETRRLERIVADLFLLARGDAREQPIVLGELYLDEVVADAVRAVRVLAARRGVQVECAPCDEELACRGDEPLLRRLVLNLLDNAVKYTPAGGHVVASARAEREHEPPLYVVEVTDTGPGIPPEAHERIFDRFYRVRQDRDGDAAGTGEPAGSGAGLGLAIARWIAEAHGGALVLARTGANGTTFRFTMPAAAMPVSAPLEPAAAPSA
jgi:heavy metal sensor kinase